MHSGALANRCRSVVSLLAIFQTNLEGSTREYVSIFVRARKGRVLNFLLALLEGKFATNLFSTQLVRFGTMSAPATSDLLDLETQYVAEVEKLALLAQRVQIQKVKKLIEAKKWKTKELHAELELADEGHSELRELCTTAEAVHQAKLAEWTELMAKLGTILEHVADSEDVRSKAAMVQERQVEIEARLSQVAALQQEVELLKLQESLQKKESTISTINESLYKMNNEVEEAEHELAHLMAEFNKMPGCADLDKSTPAENTLHEEIRMLENECENAKLLADKFQERCTKMQPLYEVGLVTRGHKLLRPFTPTSDAPGHAYHPSPVSYRGAALADATLFLDGPLGKGITSENEFVANYGFAPLTVWEYSTFTMFHDILNWSHDMKIYKLADVSSTAFDTYKSWLLERIGKNFNISSNEALERDADALRYYQGLQTERKAGLQAFQKYCKGNGLWWLGM